jgi:hypothetical protein
MCLRLVVLGMLPPLALCVGTLVAPLTAASAADINAPPTGQQPSVRPPTNSGPAAGGTAVIHPPGNVDPGISKPLPNAAPEAGRMPVIPPPDTPGGNPAVVPK